MLLLSPMACSCTVVRERWADQLFSVLLLAPRQLLWRPEQVVIRRVVKVILGQVLLEAIFDGVVVEEFQLSVVREVLLSGLGELHGVAAVPLVARLEPFLDRVDAVEAVPVGHLHTQ